MRLFLCGDVMTGRGIDQILPHPSNVILYEPYLVDARDYVDLAEKKNGPIPRRVDSKYIWGEALEELDRAAIDARIVNLETAITAAETNWPDKGIHYRMHPKNIDCLAAAQIDVCVLANNHVLDWGHGGLSETLRTLDAAQIARAGAGENAQQAAAPAIVDLASKGRVLVFSVGSTSSGIPREWATGEDSAGVNLLSTLSEEAAARLAIEIRKFQQPGDIVLVSIHWGNNWGHEIPREQIAFAHRLIEEGVAVVHGHSSHHTKAIEVFRRRLILYGCGDFLTDYEGISGYEKFRSDIAVMYLLELNRTGELISARLVPMRMHRFRLERSPQADAESLCKLLNEFGARFKTAAKLEDKQNLFLRW